ncbi:MAG TPA: 1-(5-phosphoribosyl)-5-[(5-phosphoribosylamino)methylideneamino]imidazole-4-carboxamide isomerase [Acidimicrobiales bacterium]|jgi:phosphoribosylformimino-5-aminoimidazole carboxamide ribotide isomerase|nr:1-(5-phosphoribosyl)-5-[(5-phosphoribosylamino)methylideneamino]imidazole-4-carboxamide isomerase [Acidimicrobiales bacterium]
MDLYPAVDLLDGRCVRLVQGDFERRTVYGDPVETAIDLAGSGAPWLHVVDLDAARTGHPVNRRIITDIAAAVEVPVQAGGGVRDDSGAAALLDGGVARVVLGTAAVEDADLVERLAARYPGRVAAGIDHRRGEVSLRGWTQASGAGLLEVLGRLEDLGAAAVIVTDISRDGTLAGPDLAGLSAALAVSTVDLIASGGVGSVEDLARLARLDADGRRLAGVIVGRAIHDGRLDLKEALAACAPSG